MNIGEEWIFWCSFIGKDLCLVSNILFSDFVYKKLCIFVVKLDKNNCYFFVVFKIEYNFLNMV